MAQGKRMLFVTTTITQGSCGHNLDQGCGHNFLDSCSVATTYTCETMWPQHARAIVATLYPGGKN